MSTAQAIYDTLMSPNVSDSNGEAANIVDVISAVAQSIRHAAKSLGSADAATPMGALEAHGKCILDASERIAGAISELAEAIRGHGA